ncbi:hypothetical protein DFH09DRAFT_1326279 [Mycena vulgaris]|nr:hypothetical protein DFH09DRAFT_1326279 [Mycena vulgaris]
MVSGMLVTWPDGPRGSPAPSNGVPPPPRLILILLPASARLPHKIHALPPPQSATAQCGCLRVAHPPGLPSLVAPSPPPSRALRPPPPPTPTPRRAIPYKARPPPILVYA